MFLDEVIIEPNDPIELEIRGVSVHAADLIRNQVKILDEENKFSETLNSIVIDTYLWTFAMDNKNKCQDLPHHKTRTIFY